MLLGTVTDSTEPDVFLKAPLAVNGRKGWKRPEAAPGLRDQRRSK